MSGHPSTKQAVVKCKAKHLKGFGAFANRLCVPFSPHPNINTLGVKIVLISIMPIVVWP